MNAIDYLMFWMLMFEHMEPGHTLTRSQRIYWASNSLKYLIRSHHMDCLEENRGRTILKFLKISDYYKRKDVFERASILWIKLGPIHQESTQKWLPLDPVQDLWFLLSVHLPCGPHCWSSSKCQGANYLLFLVINVWFVRKPRVKTSSFSRELRF